MGIDVNGLCVGESHPADQVGSYYPDSKVIPVSRGSKETVLPYVLLRHVQTVQLDLHGSQNKARIGLLKMLYGRSAILNVAGIHI